ncbi:MAG TPA: rod shape-determining protein MreD [Clostridiales bacterium]|nr:rod shape-determining protein MreD [Clostridiales bacterium]
MKRFIILILEILVLFIIQSTMFHYIALLNIMPNLLLIIVVSMAYINGRNYGMLTGFIVGLLLDLTFGNLIGLYALIYVTIGFLAGYINAIYSEDDYVLPVVLIAIGDLFYNFIYYIFEFLLRGKLDVLFYFRRIILPEIIYTVLASVFVYKLIHMINIQLDYGVNREV